VLSAITMPLNGCNILVQRYGAENLELRQGLEARGAAVQEIATYRWALPADTGPLVELLDGLSNARVDAVLFTSAIQMHNLYAVAEKTGHAPRLAGYLNRVLIASIGPVCSRALQQYGVTPTLEADPPKLGPFVAAVDAALS
jgi:uroporphyrinogen-III synthase